MTHEILHDGKAIRCLRCGTTSHNPEDVRHLYCGNCHQFHYTHQDYNGTLWRFVGLRPVSELADQVMLACGRKGRTES
jgi:hypothetical protein